MTESYIIKWSNLQRTHITIKILKCNEFSILFQNFWFSGILRLLVYKLELEWRPLFFSFCQSSVVVTAAAAANDVQMEEWYLSDNKVQVSMHKMYSSGHPFTRNIPHVRLTRSAKVDVYLSC